MAIRFDTSGGQTVVAEDSIFSGPSLMGQAICQPRASEVQQGNMVSLKFIGELFNEDKIILGGKESAGLSVKGHYPQKDGVLACLLAAEEMAACGANLNKQLAALEQLVGHIESVSPVSRTPRQACKPIGRSEIYLRGWVLAVAAPVGH